MRKQVVLSSGYAWVCMHSGESICDVVVLSSSVHNGAAECHEKVLPSPKLLAVWYLLHEGKQGFVIG